MVPFAEYLDVERLHVQAPSALVLLCGGRVSDIDIETPRSLRDAFLKIPASKQLSRLDIIQAEDITRLSIFGRFYDDFLEFETDFAQITDLIILFCESEGSLAELGSFVMIQETASKLFVVVRDEHWNGDSFVKLGPLTHLNRNYGGESVFVVDDADIGIISTDFSKVDPLVLSDRLEAPVLRKLESAREPTTFDLNRPGHVIKLIVGFIQEYGALTLDEIHELLLFFKVNCETRVITRYLLCAEQARWIVEIRKGNDDYFIARGAKKDAATFYTKDDAPIRNKARRRSEILDYWRANGSNRFRGIQQGRALS